MFEAGQGRTSPVLAEMSVGYLASDIEGLRWGISGQTSAAALPGCGSNFVRGGGEGIRGISEGVRSTRIAAQGLWQCQGRNLVAV